MDTKDRPTPKRPVEWLNWLDGTIGVVSIGLAVFRASDMGTWKTVDHVDWITLTYLFLPIAIILLPKLTEFSLTKDGISWKRALERTLSETQENVATANDRLDALASVLKSTPGGAPGRKRSLAEPEATHGAKTPSQVNSGDTGLRGFAREEELPPVTNVEDPQKGRWGGQPETSTRLLSAIVKPVRGDDDYFRIVLKIESKDPRNSPLRGTCRFHLHDTFHPQMEEVQVADGFARLEVYAWGAFTVGAETDMGATRLELDLTTVPGAPTLFASR